MPTPVLVHLGSEADAALARWADSASLVAEPLLHGDPAPALELAAQLAAVAPAPGQGRTRELWSLLATVAAQDLAVARLAEPHLDALAILGQVDDPPPLTSGASYGVYAAEASGMRLVATPAGSGWSLTGRKPWCSLAGFLSHALVTAHTDAGRGLFLVDLDHARPVTQERWASRGLASIPSSSLDFDGVAGTAVGEPGWYLARPGFWWGGMGVAAIWFGGAVALARSLADAAGRREPDQVALAHVGALDRQLAAAGSLLGQAADDVDAGQATGDAGYRLMLQVRRTVHECATDVLARVGRGLGPGPLATDEEHARRVADLTVYLRQDHAERDDVALGRLALAGEEGWPHA